NFNFKTVFDVGGNVGDYSLLLRKYFPNAAIHTFEIIDDNIVTIQEKNAGDNNITINSFGLSNENGTIDVKYYGKGSGLNSLHDYPHSGESVWKECEIRKGDDYVQENGIESIDFLKIDTEGSENLVLEGLLDTLKNRDVKVIQFEYGYINIISKFLLYDFYQFFDELGYTIGKIYPKRVEFKEYSLKDENFFGPNYVAVKKSETEIIESLAK
ncbi:MAG: FkbM family methyltransferase, partial [Gammaproteobacteria bacterium]|nr:FkbM family methyltransferase [Gammaproteobacteria bacterium]